MIYRLLVPTTFDDTDAVRVLEWHFRPNDRVSTGSLFVELETHKALIEVRAGRDGVVRRLLVGEGEWCPLGGALALLSDEAEEPIDETASEWVADFAIG